MLAIVTKTTPATATKGLRVTAVWGENRHSNAYDHSKNAKENHDKTALELLNRLKADGIVNQEANTLVRGELGKGQIVTSRAYVIYDPSAIIA
jgi:hypothetical protein